MGSFKPFAERKFKHLGVDASENVVKTAKEKGINAVCKFFNEQASIEIMNTMEKLKLLLLQIQCIT